MAEMIMLLSMLLFIGFCSVIMGLAIYEVYIRKEGDEGAGAAAAKANKREPNTCA